MRTSFPTKETTSAVAARLGVDWDPTMQDWAIEVADETRVQEFVDALSSTRDREERICLLDLVLASLDEWITAREPIHDVQLAELTGRWSSDVESALREFPDIAVYWTAHDFPVAQFIRLISDARR